MGDNIDEASVLKLTDNPSCKYLEYLIIAQYGVSQGYYNRGWFNFAKWKVKWVTILTRPVCSS